MIIDFFRHSYIGSNRNPPMMNTICLSFNICATVCVFILTPMCPRIISAFGDKSLGKLYSGKKTEEKKGGVKKMYKMGLKKPRNVESKDYGEEWRELGGKRGSRK